MHWTKFAVAAAFAALAQPALADVVVIRANGPSAGRFPPGKTLPDATRLTLKQGDQIVLLDTHGTRTLAGPGVFAATGGPAVAAPSALSAMASNATNRRARVGAVRGLTAVPPVTTTRPGIFLVDVAVPGSVCVVDSATVTLWRGDARAAAATTLTGGDGTTATVSWIRGQTTAPWPVALRVAEGSSYRLRSTAGAAETIVQFRTLAAQPANLQQLASALIKHGCQGQVDVLVATTPTSVAAAGS